MWNLNLDPENPNLHNPNKQHETPETINVIYNLPSSRKTFLWYHASAGFPPKETFINAVRNGNYATWPKLTVTLINRYFPDSDKIIKRHLEGKHQGIRSTKEKAMEKIIENKTVRIKIKGENTPFHHIPLTKTHKEFFHMEDISESIHTELLTRQRIYHGGNPPQCKLHLCQTYAKQVKGRDDKGIQENYKQNEIGRSWTQETHIGQQSLGGLQTMHPRTTIAIQTSLPGQSLMQPGRAHNSNIQSALHLDSSRCRQQVSTLPAVPPP
jgi:hypothetical protein